MGEPEQEKPEDKLAEIEKRIDAAVKEWISLRDGVPCYPLLLDETMITDGLVDDVFDDLHRDYSASDQCLDVVVTSSGGDIDAAYNLALLFRRYGKDCLQLIVPRWAKSAATMLVCAGDRILMSPVAELGPLDPQITEMNLLEGRREQFSPLHIESTMNLIRNECEQGSAKLADKLMERLQFPITLGRYRSLINIGNDYLRKLLSTRMLKDKPAEVVDQIAKKLTSGYTDHGYCIAVEEAASIGLVAEELSNEH